MSLVVMLERKDMCGLGSIMGWSDMHFGWCVFSVNVEMADMKQLRHSSKHINAPQSGNGQVMKLKFAYGI